VKQISKKLRFTLLIGLQIVLQIFLPPGHAEAHQPYFEDSEFTYSAPWPVPDATISTAVYGTLSSATDVDYFTFEGYAGQSVLLAMSIPQIQGQDYFAPSIALMGADLAANSLPNQIQSPAGHGAVIVADPGGEAPTFFEPFSRTRYWRRQRQYVNLPTAGTYLVAVWSPNGALGRYTFVIGDREVRGGDPAFSTTHTSSHRYASTDSYPYIDPYACTITNGYTITYCHIVTYCDTDAPYIVREILDTESNHHRSYRNFRK